MVQLQMVRTQPDETLKEKIEKAIRITEEILRDIKEDEWGQILQLSSILSNALDQLEVIYENINYLINKMSEAKDMNTMWSYVKDLRRWVQRLA